jgi:hypothetical protein
MVNKTGNQANEKERIARALEKQKSELIMRQGNISLVLDSYDDIFSDFDPRPFSERALSDDFLAECKRAARDKKAQGIELRLMIPKNKRKKSDDIMIIHRIKNHFHKHSLEEIQAQKATRLEGIAWIMAGIAFSLIATSLYSKTEAGFAYTLFLVIFEPAGWFSFWTGFDKLLLEERERKPDYDFYSKMTKAEISFNTY